MTTISVFYEGPIVTREEAKAGGLKRYFTAAPCSSGHVAQRHTKEKRCVECRRLSKGADYRRNAQKRLRQQAEYTAKNAERIRQRRRQYRLKNLDRLKAGAKAHYVANRDRINADNRQYYQDTKPARQAAAKRWRERNQPHIKVNRKEYVAKNRKVIMEKKRADYVKNKEAVKARAKKWAVENREERRRIGNAWAKRNPDYMRAATAMRRSSKRDGRVTRDDLARIMKGQRGRCAACRKKLNGQFHVDHIVAIKRGGTSKPSNLQMLCPPCNRSKGTKDPIDFMRERGFLL